MFEGVEGVYLLHFEQNFSHARHYIGWSSDIGARVALHQKGQSQVALTRAVSRSQIAMSAVRVWQGADRHFERKLKKKKKSWLMCPVCNPNHWQTNGVNGEADEQPNLL